MTPPKKAGGGTLPGNKMGAFGLGAAKPGSKMGAFGLGAAKPGSMMGAFGLGAAKPGSQMGSLGLPFAKPGSKKMGAFGLGSGDAAHPIGPKAKNISGHPPHTQLHRLGPPFSEGFDRSVDTIQSPTSGGGGGIEPPLYLQRASAINVKVKTGTVGGIIPTGVATNIDVSGTDGTWYIFLDATIDADGDVTAADISSNTSGVPSDSSTHAYYLIGTAEVASSVLTAVNPTLMFSQEFVACGRDPADPSTTPGTYYFFVA